MSWGYTHRRTETGTFQCPQACATPGNGQWWQGLRADAGAIWRALALEKRVRVRRREKDALQEVGRLPRARGAARGPGMRGLELYEANRIGVRQGKRTVTRGEGVTQSVCVNSLV